jgi:hypothetical protein
VVECDVVECDVVECDVVECDVVGDGLGLTPCPSPRP